MSRFIRNNLQNKTGKTVVLLTNLGTPSEPTTPALRSYLREFLSDPRVVEIPRLIWMFILYCFVLTFRPKKSAKLYKSIWTDEGSPLLVISEAQKNALSERLKDKYGDDVEVALAMRYGKPAISDALKRLQANGVDNIVVLPLYPQYAGPTTGSTFDAIAKEIGQWRWVPSIHFISSYHEHELYINALANTVNEHLDTHGKPDKLVLSYHGMPKLFATAGDPYEEFCHKTTELLKEKLVDCDLDIMTTFQSRFGKAEWLKPYTDETLSDLPSQGCKNIAIMSPAFSVDCLETIEELEEENREIFIEAGGESYHYIKALNERADHIDMMESLVTPYLNK